MTPKAAREIFLKKACNFSEQPERFRKSPALHADPWGQLEGGFSFWTFDAFFKGSRSFLKWWLCRGAPPRVYSTAISGTRNKQDSRTSPMRSPFFFCST